MSATATSPFSTPHSTTVTDPGRTSSGVITNTPSDMISLRSSDGKFFPVKVKNLEVHSIGILPTTIPHHSSTVVNVPEPAAVLELLIQFMYRQRQPSLLSINFKTLLAVAEAAEKYGIYAATQICSIRMGEQAHKSPICALNYAIKSSYDNTAKIAAFYSLSQSLTDVSTAITTACIKRWVLYYHGWLDLIQRALLMLGDSQCHCKDQGAFWSTLLYTLLANPAQLKQPLQLSQALFCVSGCDRCRKWMKSLPIIATNGLFIPPVFGGSSSLLIPLTLNFRLLAGSKPEPQPEPVHSPKFCLSDADLTFRSADGVIFRVHRRNLELMSDGFFTGDGVVSSATDVVMMHESSAVLELLFQYMYRQPQPDLQHVPFKLLAELAEAAEKFQVYPAMEICKTRMGMAMNEHSAGVLSYAVRHSYKEFIDQAAFKAVSMPLDQIVAEISPNVLHLWLKYYHEWTNILFFVYKDGAGADALHLSSCASCIKSRIAIRRAVGVRVSKLQEIDDVFRPTSATYATGHPCLKMLDDWKAEIKGKVYAIPKFSSFM